ncbi:MAG: lipid A export permease/ATP-binding protein MsbA [Gammaproteobacteria bacterium]|nr:MAG: lipid A export permease/ATP-binding protein MsbA [Gammaproteobacteria bacterium]
MATEPETLSSAETYRRLLRYVKPYTKVFVFAALAMAVVSATEAAFALLMEPIIDGGFVERDQSIIRIIPFAVIGLFLIKGISSFIASYGVNWVGRSVVRDMRRAMFEHLLYAPSSYYDKSSSGHLLAKLTFNADQVAQAASNAITILIKDSLLFIYLMGVLFYHSWLLTLVFLVVAPLIAVIIWQISKRFRQISQNIQESVGDVSHVSEEAIEGYRVIKIYAGQQYENGSFDRVNERNRQQVLKMEAAKALGISVIELIAAVGLAVVIYIAMHDSMKEVITAGVFTSYITALILLFRPIKKLMSVNAYIQRGIAAGQSIFEMIDYEKEKDTGTRSIDRIKGQIEFDNVVFRYESSVDDVLKGLSFNISAGQTAAFVGKSGSGKTTLINLMPRFYDISAGAIRIDGVDSQDISLYSLRSQIALVGQDVTLFNDTIRNNIAYGELSAATDEDILKAAEMAHAMEFIGKMPEGFDTMVGENGVLLSGGQRQRLAITRAILKDAPILILDEATSALDSESERYIQSALESLLVNRTTMVVAHRLSTIENADVIFVMDEGRIVESGTHDELIKNNGHYANFYRMQHETEVDNLIA